MEGNPRLMARILITAGATSVPIDSARKITNMAKGLTGQTLAFEAASRGHKVCLLTSNPYLTTAHEKIETILFDTFEDLNSLLKNKAMETSPDAVIMTAAVSDYGCSGIFTTPSPETPIATIDAKKIPGHHDELWLRLKPLPKLIDQFRTKWNFCGILVKFKLESQIDEQKLLSLAEESRLHSKADLMVANRLEDASNRAWIGPLNSRYKCVDRENLAMELINAIETMLESR